MSNVTTPSPETGLPVNGYIVIAPLSAQFKKHIQGIQQGIQARFPDNKFWFPTAGQLHITFAHIVTPNVDYPKNHNQVWQGVRSNALAALKQSIPNPLAVNVRFNTIEAYAPSILIKGTDDGTYDKLRQEFVSKFKLPEGSRQPPNIIHATIARFYDQMDLAEVQEYVNGLDQAFTETTTELDVIHETGLYVYEYTVLERFP